MISKEKNKECINASGTNQMGNFRNPGIINNVNFYRYGVGLKMSLGLVIATKHRKVTFIAGSGEYSIGVEREKLEKTNAKCSHFSM